MTSNNPHQPSANVDLQVAKPYQKQAPGGRLAAAVQATLNSQGRHEAELALVIVGDEELRRLNRDYRGSDAPTDVLAFPAYEEKSDESPSFVSAPEAANYLGDVIISYPTADRQARAAGHPVADELCLLAVHGVLHLLGYDHATPAQRAAMWAAQSAVLADLGVTITTIEGDAAQNA